MVFKQSKEYQRGFLTLEILLAMAVMVLTLSAAAILSFGGQNLVADSQIGSEALRLAQEMIESQNDLAKIDFRLVNPASAAEGLFEKKIEVESVPFFTKEVKAKVSWNIDGRPREVELVSLITDYNATAGNDTCDSNLSGDWGQPQIRKVIDFNDFAESATSTYTVSGVDAYKNKLYVSISDTADKNDPVFFVFDITDPFAPVLLNKIDNNANAKSGINALTVNGDYAYAASSGSEQLQIIDIAANPPAIINSYKIIGAGNGKSIFYKNGYVYLGLASNNNIPEFRIIDVKNVSNLFEIGYWPPAGGLKHGINSIYVRGRYAYLVHPTDADESGGCPQEQATVLNISDPINPIRVSGFYYPGSMGGNGKSLCLIGLKMYFGRTTSHIYTSGLADAIPEFYILDNSDPGSIPAAALGSMALPEVDSINKLLVRDYLAFLLTNKQLKIFRVDNPLAIAPYGNFVDISGTGAAMDCEGNNLFIGSVSGAGKSYLTVVTSK